MPSIYFYTLGCKLNFTETSTLKRIAKDKGFSVTSDITKAEVIVINTCTVTQTADKKSRYAIRHLHNQSPNAKVLVTGCYADVDPNPIKQMEGVTYIFGNEDKANFDKILSKIKIATDDREITEKKFFKAYSLGDRTRSFLKVQDGCDYFCAYCKVPYARGRSRNAPISELVAQANEIAAHGIKEIVLTGINIGDFGHTTNENFFDLIKSLEKETSIERYRISSIEPNLLTDEIIDFVLSSKRFVPHFHIPLQSGSDSILKAMHRKYDSKLFAQKIEYILRKNPLAGIGIDVIVGFPGERDELFKETYQLLKNLDFSYLHVFEYSERSGTKATSLPNKVNDKAKKERSKVLHQLSEKKHELFAQKNAGLIRPVLIERKEKNQYLTGFTDNYIKVQILYSPNLINKIVQAELMQWNIELELMDSKII